MMAQWLRLLRFGSWYRCAMAMPYSSAVAAIKENMFLKTKTVKFTIKLHQQPNILSSVANYPGS
jgi:hypothetical protein